MQTQRSPDPGVEPRPPEADPEQAAAIERILTCELGFLADRIVDKRMMPRGIAEEALREYRRFMVLSLLSDEVPMFSAEVDEIWHAHILHTHDYQRFCRENFGYFVHHRPEPLRPAAPGEADVAEAAAQREEFFRSYRVRFGEPSTLWGHRARR